MASTPKSIRKNKKIIAKRIVTSPTITSTTSGFEGEFFNSKCNPCYQLSSTIKTTSSGCCCCCCCCGCCCSNNNNNNQQQQQPLPTINAKQIYLAHSNSGYKLVQVIDKKIAKRTVKNKLNYDIKLKYNKYYAKKAYKNKLPLSLQPIDVKDFERQDMMPAIPEPKIASTTISSAYDISCNQVVNCNGYLKKFIEKTKKNLKAQTMKKKCPAVNTAENAIGKKEEFISDKIDSIKKRKICLFQRKLKKSLIKQSDFKIENNLKLNGELVLAENNDNIENRSFVQDTFLTDFNQFGQFRVWYV